MLTLVARNLSAKAVVRRRAQSVTVDIYQLTFGRKAALQCFVINVVKWIITQSNTGAVREFVTSVGAEDCRCNTGDKSSEGINHQLFKMKKQYFYDVSETIFDLIFGFKASVLQDSHVTSIELINNCEKPMDFALLRYNFQSVVVYSHGKCIHYLFL